MGIADLLPEDLKYLFQKPVDLIFDKMTGGQLYIGGVQVNKEKAIEILVKPVGYDTFLALHADTIKQLKGELLYPHKSYPVTPNNIDDYFELDEVLTVSLKQSMKDKIKTSHEYYAKSDQAKKMLAFAQAVIAAYDAQGIKDFTKSNGAGITGIVEEIINNPFGQGLSLNINGVLRYN